MAEFHYFACDGGPHLVLPASARAFWRGVGANYDPLDPNTDYARACGVEPPTGLIPVGTEQALVLAGSPPMSAWSGVPEQGSICLHIFRSWSNPNLDSLASAAVEALPADKLTDTGLRWTVRERGLVLMFAGDIPGKSAYGELPIPVPEGTYVIHTGNYEGDAGKVLIVRLERENA